VAQHIRILTVEDSPLDAELIERELRQAKLDFSSQRVETEQDFRAALESSDPDVILADFNLPHFDGISALKIAHALVPETPFIFVSGSIGEERAVQALLEGATDYILKDRLSRLPAAITRALDERRERQLSKRLSHQNELILKYSAEGILAVDRQGKAFLVNPAAARITGFSIQELQAVTSIHDAIHHSRSDGSPYPAAECPMLQTLQDGVPRVSQEVFWRKSGEPFPVDYSASPIYEGDEIAGVVEMFQDIGERKRLEKSLEQANRVSSLGRVAATIAHEFNNVLMGIQPFAEVIRRNKAADEKMQKAAEQIIGSVNRGKRVTQSILRFTQPAEPSLQPVKLSDWLHQLVPELRAVIGQRIVIDIDVPDRPIAALCDSVQLQQVVTNLVINARDAMPDGGTITLTIADSRSGEHFHFGNIPPEMILLAVQDTGTGMSAAVQQNIFEPLFTTKRSGTGLGLAVAQQVIARHGGSIHVQSAPGAGTTFFILLQAAPNVAASQEKRRENDGRIHRVLLVEDEPAVGEGIAALLQGEGIEVRLVKRGSEAQAAALSFRPEAVVLDIGLPDMNGWDVYLALRKTSPGLPIVFSSGHGDQGALEREADASSVAFLRKPYDIDTLIEVLHKVIGEREQVAE
jgi:PAS domain S-box-containing protein